MISLQLLLFTLAGSALIAAWTWLYDRPMALWAADHGVPLDDETAPAISAYLPRARLYRSLGAAAGGTLPLLIGAAFGSDLRHSGNHVWPALGFVYGHLIGTVLAIGRRRGAPCGPARAAITPRTFTDYVPPAALWAQRLLPFAALGVVAATGDAVGPAGAWSASRALLLTLAACCATVSFTVEATQRRIVGLRQPFVSASWFAADDALRAQMARSLAGTAIALPVLVAECAIQGAAAQSTGATMVGLSALALLCSAAAWCAVAQPARRHWRLARSSVSPLGGIRA